MSCAPACPATEESRSFLPNFDAELAMLMQAQLPHLLRFSPPVPSTLFSNGSDDREHDFSAFIHLEDSPLAQLDCLPSIEDRDLLLAEPGGTGFGVWTNTTASLEPWSGEGTRDGPVQPSMNILDKSSDLPPLNPDQGSATPDQSSDSTDRPSPFPSSLTRDEASSSGPLGKSGLDKLADTVVLCTVDGGPIDPYRHPLVDAAPCVPQAPPSILEQVDSTVGSINQPSNCKLGAKNTCESIETATAIDRCTEDLVCRSGPSSRPTTPVILQAPTVACAADDRSDCGILAKNVSKPLRAAAPNDGYDKESSYRSDSSPSDRRESPATSVSGHRSICTSVAGVQEDPPFRGFKSPVQLIESTLSMLSPSTGTKRSASYKQGAVGNPIIVNDEEPRRSKRQRVRRPQQNDLTSEEVLGEFKALGETRLMAERQLQLYGKAYDSFAELLRGLGYPVCL
ncbi:MAG: hypothetical protein Q9178_005121 [Gyalolechia marmorata]